jgi:hypothetical protein
MSVNGNDPANRRKPDIATARAKELSKGLAEFGAGVDAFCARMNTGLCAVAIVLGFAVLVTLSIHAPAMTYYSPDLQAAEDVAVSAN